MIQGLITHSHGEALARLTTPELLKEAIGEVVSSRLTSSKTEELVDWILKRTKLRRDVNEFVNSEEFILTLYYWRVFLILGDVKLKTCPSCSDNTLEYNDDDKAWTCSRCGWDSDDADSKLRALARRSRYLLLKKGVNSLLTRIVELEGHMS